MHIANFRELEAYLQQHAPRRIERDGVYNLDRMRQLMPLLGSPQEKLKIVHVAGTSGKTSTCYFTAALLQAAGQKVGLSVSPHVFSIAERAQINGKLLDEREFCDYFSSFITIPGVQELEPTYFETLVAFAFWLFVEEACDYAVIEVGLGGLLDGTNVIENPDKIAVITDIGLDHTHILGDTIPAIARQKAGIIKGHNHVCMMQQPSEVEQVIRAACEAAHAPLHIFTLDDKQSYVKAMPQFQQRNWYLAYQVYSLLSVRDNLPVLDHQQQQQTQATAVPARMQQLVARGKKVVLDGAHNPQKLTALISSMRVAFPDSKIALLVSFAQAKQVAIRESMGLLAELSDTVIATAYWDKQDNLQKSMQVDEVAETAIQVGFKYVLQEVVAGEAFDRLLECSADVLLVTGSFYLVDALQPKLKEYL